MLPDTLPVEDDQEPDIYREPSDENNESHTNPANFKGYRIFSWLIYHGQLVPGKHIGPGPPFVTALANCWPEIGHGVPGKHIGPVPSFAITLPLGALRAAIINAKTVAT
jgi:hypothetical protein